MHQVQPEQLLETLKRALRNRRITYAQLADELGMSESGIKKLLTADDVSLSRLSAICDVLGVSVVDVVSEAASPAPTVFVPDEGQRAAFIAEPRLLVVLWALGEHKGDVESTRARLGLDRRTMRRLVRKLARVETIEVLDADRVRLRYPESTDWRLPADVGRAVMAPLQDALLGSARSHVERGAGEHVDLGFARLQLHPNTVRELQAAMRALLREMGARSRRERALHRGEALVEVGAMTVLAPYGLADELASVTP